MGALRHVKTRIRVLLYKFFDKRFRSISINARIGSNVHFEGANSVGAGTYVENAEIGYGTYLSDGCVLPNTRIGRFCSIAPDVRRVSGTHPSSVFVSTYPAFFSKQHPYAESYVSDKKFDEYKYAEGKRSIIIGNDVWIGYGVRILDGVTVGDGAIIAAGAVVTRNIEPYEVVGGVPAKTIKYRFAKEEIQRLLEIQWWNQPLEWIRMNAEKFESIDAFLEK